MGAGIIHKVLGTVTYLVKCEARIRYCHVDHPIQSEREVLDTSLFGETTSIRTNQLMSKEISFFWSADS